MPVITTFGVSTETQLDQALIDISLGGTQEAGATAYTIIIQADLSLTSALPAIDLGAGSSLSILGNNPGSDTGTTALITGGVPGFTVTAGSVSLSNLNLQGLRAPSGGAAIAVAAGATLSTSGVNFSGDRVNSGAAGGAVAVQPGGVLSIGAGTLAAASGTANAAYIQGNATLIVTGGAVVTGAIADQSGAGTVDIAGSATLAAPSTYSGGTVIGLGIGASVLTVAAPGAAGSGSIGFAAIAGNELVVDAGDTPVNALTGLVPGDLIDLQGVGLATSAPIGIGNHVAVTGATSPITLNLDPAINYASSAFSTQPDSSGTGTLLSLVQSGYTVASEADLNAALKAIDLSGGSSTPNMAYSITFAQGFTLSSDIYAINLAAGDSLNIAGAGATLDGGGQYRGFFDYSGTVSINDLTIADATAMGGAGGAGATPGGGGAGLGGGLFIASAGAVTLSNVNFVSDSAIGGAAGANNGVAVGGGGGLGGAGGAGGTTGSGTFATRSGGGGGIGVAAVGGTYSSTQSTLNGGPGIVPGVAGGGSGTGPTQGFGTGGAYGGGGGVQGVFPLTSTGGSGRGGGGGHTTPAHFGVSGSGGIAASFGGGGGLGSSAGFGGGGASSAGGWGGGGGGGAAGGFGAGGGGAAGGGLGAGGDVFVQQGGSLTVLAGTMGAGTVTGGTGTGGGSSGAALGGSILLQGNETASFAPGLGQTLTIAGGIDDQSGNGGTGANAGAGSLVMNGPGTLLLSATDRFTGGMRVTAGTISLKATSAAGTGPLVFAYGATAEILAGLGDLPSGTIGGFLPGITFDLQGIGTATAATRLPGNTLSVTGGTTPVTLTLDPAQIFTGEAFEVQSDNAGGSFLTAVTTGNDHPPFITGAPATVTGDDHTPFSPLAGVNIADLDAGQSETVTVTLSNTIDGTLSTLSGGAFDPTTGIYIVTGSAAAVTSALQTLTFTPADHQVAPGTTVTTTFAIAVTDGTMQAAATDTADVTALNDAPVIAPSPLLQQDPYDYGILLYGTPQPVLQGFTVNDPDLGASETLTLTIPSTVGTLSAPGLVPTGTAGAYTFTGSPAAVTALLGTLTITPIPPPATPGPDFFSLGISVSDGIATAPTTTSVSMTLGTPFFINLPLALTALGNTGPQPFQATTLQDTYLIDSFTIDILDGTGTPTDALGALYGTGLTQTGVGAYAFTIQNPGTGDPANLLTPDLQSVIFVPATPTIAATATLALGVQDPTAYIGRETILTITAACYRAGTRILTANGEVPVEALREGDHVATLNNGLRPISWIGHRAYAAAFVARSNTLRPILIRSGALAEAVPHRDLLVSPQHALFLDGVLIPAHLLVNGATIQQGPQGDVHYFHIELDTHDIILAEGAPAESFIDHDSRMLFENGHERAHLNAGETMSDCVPRILHGRRLETIRRRLDARAGLRPASLRAGEQRGPLRGNLECVSATHITGWAHNPDHPHTPQLLVVTVSGIIAGRVLANRFRDDLRDAGLGNGACAFACPIPPTLRGGEVIVRRASDGAELGRGTAAPARAA